MGTRGKQVKVQCGQHGSLFVTPSAGWTPKDGVSYYLRITTRDDSARDATGREEEAGLTIRKVTYTVNGSMTLNGQYRPEPKRYHGGTLARRDMMYPHRKGWTNINDPISDSAIDVLWACFEAAVDAFLKLPDARMRFDEVEVEELRRCIESQKEDAAKAREQMNEHEANVNMLKARLRGLE